VAAMVAHGELARARPAADYLTEFYLWLSVGGVLGGLFNAVLAPVLFHRTGLTEYPLAIALACMVRPPFSRDPNAAPSAKPQAMDVILPLGVGLLTVGLIYLTVLLKMDEGAPRSAVRFGLPCILAYLLVDRPIRYGLGLATGSLAYYARPGDDWTMFEIDPAVQRVAEDPRYFNFLSECRAPYRVVLGDARLRLQDAADHSYDLIVLDAFSSDAIPMHLL